MQSLAPAGNSRMLQARIARPQASLTQPCTRLASKPLVRYVDTSRTASATGTSCSVLSSQRTLGLRLRSKAVNEEVAEKKAKMPLLSTDDIDVPDEELDRDENCSVFVDRDGNIIETMCCDYGYRTGAERMYSADAVYIPQAGFILAWKNFEQELINLRFMFRDDEFATMSEMNPPKGWVGKAAYDVGKGAVKGMANFDRTLEKTGVLPKLRVPLDADGNATSSDKDMDMSTSNRPACVELRDKLKKLKLSNTAVWDREHAREKQGQAVATPWYVKGVYLSLCILLDVLFNNRPIQRFWFLETVARMPYFSYISCLHMYESLGWWRAGAELRKIHFAEEWNELHHLQIMESLGGDRLWADRFFAYHSAIVYYWLLVLLFIFNPRLAYNFSELIESHAVDTYGEFCDANEVLLKSMPPPLVAVQYYRSNDLYYFDEFQTSASSRSEPRTPATNNLYDVFINIRDDEGEHVKTMVACQDNSVASELAARRDLPRRL